MSWYGLDMMFAFVKCGGVEVWGEVVSVLAVDFLVIDLEESGIEEDNKGEDWLEASRKSVIGL